MADVPKLSKVLRSRAAFASAAALAAGFILTGCTAQGETARPAVVTNDDAAVEVQTVPADVYTYPRSEYRGRTVYLVNGRWYYPHGQHWYYYRAEPPELVRHRRYVEQAPPAGRVYQPPPGDAVRVH